MSGAPHSLACGVCIFPVSWASTYARAGDTDLITCHVSSGFTHIVFLVLTLQILVGKMLCMMIILIRQLTHFYCRNTHRRLLHLFPPSLVDLLTLSMDLSRFLETYTCINTFLKIQTYSEYLGVR